MTDRLNGVYVAFHKEIRTDDAESTIAAIRHIRGVIAVEPRIADHAHYEAIAKVLHVLRGAMLDAMVNADYTFENDASKLIDRLHAALSDENVNRLLNPKFWGDGG